MNVIQIRLQYRLETNNALDNLSSYCKNMIPKAFNNYNNWGVIAILSKLTLVIESYSNQEIKEKNTS